MRNNLIPTVIVDKNNKVTTVHKRNGVPVPSVSRLGSIKPTVGAPQPKPSKAVSKVRYSATKYGSTNSLSLGDLSFLARAGLQDRAKNLLEKIGDEGTVDMPDEALYDYLRLGIEPAEAAILHTLSGGDLEKLKRNKAFKDALPGNLASQRVWGGGDVDDKGITEVVDYLAGAGVKPSKIAAALRNNLNNENLARSVLEPQELAELFARFTYSLSKNEERGTAASRTMDALSDGRLPIILADRKTGVDRPVITTMLEAMYPKNKAERGLMSEGERNDLLASDPEILLHIAKVLEKHNLRGGDVASTQAAVRQFGAEACIAYDPQVLAAKHSDGTVLGVEGAQNALRFIENVQAQLNKGGRIHLSKWGTGTEYRYWDNGETVMLNVADLSDLHRLGYSEAEIKRMTIDNKMDSHRVVAIKVGNTVPVISEGWL